MAENINRMRYMSHFRAIHRGSFFQEMRTTEVRALLPDAWGFVCPVHTPDGAPCGLLNHLTMSVHVTTGKFHIHEKFSLVQFHEIFVTSIKIVLLLILEPEKSTGIPKVLSELDMIPVNIPLQDPTAYPVMLDGKLLGK